MKFWLWKQSPSASDSVTEPIDLVAANEQSSERLRVIHACALLTEGSHFRFRVGSP